MVIAALLLEKRDRLEVFEDVRVLATQIIRFRHVVLAGATSGMWLGLKEFEEQH